MPRPKRCHLPSLPKNPPHFRVFQAQGLHSSTRPYHNTIAYIGELFVHPENNIPVVYVFIEECQALPRLVSENLLLAPCAGLPAMTQQENRAGPLATDCSRRSDLCRQAVFFLLCGRSYLRFYCAGGRGPPSNKDRSTKSDL